MTDHGEYCERCQRPAPTAGAPADCGPWPASWEVITLAGGEVGAICPDCVTSEEQAAIDEDLVELEASLSACARCEEAAPEFASGIPEDVGWYVVEDGLACPTCVTQEERDKAAAESVQALAWERRLRGESESR